MTKIKICGIRTPEDALAAVEAGADLLGFNFYPKSARFIDPETCGRITSMLRRRYPAIQRVGVFVNSSLEEIERMLERCSLDLAQLSGDEPAELCAALAGRAFKSFHGIPGRNVQTYARSSAPALLVDGAVSGTYGGTGMRADWAGAARLARDYPLLLAGGLRAENAAEAVGQVKPWGVDVASGVESEPGKKDASKMKAFVSAVRSMEMEAI